MNFIRYTFKPGFSLFLFLVSVFTVFMLTGFYIAQQPIYFFSLLFLYVALLGFCFFASLLNYLHYKKHAPRSLRWDAAKGKLVDEVFDNPYQQ